MITFRKFITIIWKTIIGSIKITLIEQETERILITTHYIPVLLIILITELINIIIFRLIKSQ